MLQYFGIQPYAKVLYVECAKAFLLYDLFKHDPFLNLYGIDVSK
jgi:hypothetical protein